MFAVPQGTVAVPQGTVAVPQGTVAVPQGTAEPRLGITALGQFIIIAIEYWDYLLGVRQSERADRMYMLGKCWAEFRAEVNITASKGSGFKSRTREHVSVTSRFISLYSHICWDSILK